jgi:predicted MFS family arabinose efflux permease
MGINGSIINGGMLTGSIVSGELTTTFGYSATFILAIVALAASFVMLSRTSGQKSIVIVEAIKTQT